MLIADSIGTWHTAKSASDAALHFQRTQRMKRRIRWASSQAFTGMSPKIRLVTVRALNASRVRATTGSSFIR
jgi:hypothetical protein